MPKYHVPFTHVYTRNGTVEIEADSPDEAIEKLSKSGNPDDFDIVYADDGFEDIGIDVEDVELAE